MVWKREELKKKDENKSTFLKYFISKKHVKLLDTVSHIMKTRNFYFTKSNKMA
jgi:hypothetical protein